MALVHFLLPLNASDPFYASRSTSKQARMRSPPPRGRRESGADRNGRRMSESGARANGAAGDDAHARKGGASGSGAAGAPGSSGVDREKTCPMLLRVFCSTSRHNPLQDYNRGTEGTGATRHLQI